MNKTTRPIDPNAQQQTIRLHFPTPIKQIDEQIIEIKVEELPFGIFTDQFIKHLAERIGTEACYTKLDEIDHKLTLDSILRQVK